MPSMPLSSYPLCSSQEVMDALAKCGTYPGESRTVTHASVLRVAEDGRLVRTVVLLGKEEINRLTLKRILEGLEIPLEAFKSAL